MIKEIRKIESPYFLGRKEKMCDIFDDVDFTKLETYYIERPRYAGVRCNAYAEWALNELAIDILAEWDSRYDPESERPETPVVKIIDRFIQRMRQFRKMAPVGKRLMFTIAIKEAEGLKTVFVERKD